MSSPNASVGDRPIKSGDDGFKVCHSREGGNPDCPIKSGNDGFDQVGQ
jgi:hypothetical protein